MHCNYGKWQLIWLALPLQSNPSSFLLILHSIVFLSSALTQIGEHCTNWPLSFPNWLIALKGLILAPTAHTVNSLPDWHLVLIYMYRNSFLGCVTCYRPVTGSHWTRSPYALLGSPPKGHLFSFWDLYSPLIHIALLVTLMDLPGHLSVTM